MTKRKQIKNQLEFILADELRQTLGCEIDEDFFGDLCDELYEKEYYILQDGLSLAVRMKIYE